MRQDMRLALPAAIVWIVIELPMPWLGWAMLSGICVLLGGLLLFRHGVAEGIRGNVAIAGLAIGLSSLTTMIHGVVDATDAVKDLHGSIVTIEGQVSRHVELDDDTYRTVVDVERIHSHRGSWSSQSAVRIETTDRAIVGANRQDVIVTRGLLRESWEGDSAAGIIRGGTILEVVPARGLDGWASLVREKLIGAGTEGHRALVAGVVVGDDSFLSEELETQMRALGLAHLTAVSGAHVSLVLGGALAIIGRRRPLLAAAGSLGALYVLVAVVGSEPSVIRAGIMGMFICAAIALRRPTSAFPLVCIVIIGVSLIDPDLAGSLGMRLSAIATAAIVVLGYPLKEHLAKRMPLTLAELIAIPLVAGIATSPFLIGVQEVSSIWAVAANALVAPVIAPLTIIGLLGAVLLPYVSQPALTMLDVASLCTWWIETVSKSLFALPGSEVSVQASLVANLIALFVLVAWCVGGRVWRGALVLLTSVLVIAGSLHAAKRFLDPAIPRNWEIVQCDVGQGSALLARDDERVVLIDVGEEGAGIDRCLREARVTHIDLLILTHFDSDHVGGISEMLDQVNVGDVWLSTNHNPSRNSDHVIRELTTRGVPIHYPQVDQVWPANTSDPLVTLLAPEFVSGYSDSTNEDSLVVRIDTASLVTYALADIPERRQDQLARSFRANTSTDHRGVHDSRRTAVVVAHHGARDQSEHLARVLNPDVSLFSVGDNSYGHPHEDALRVWQAPIVARTDECGHISLTPDGVVSRCGG